jgi:phage antirepressor YoqD-like protein
MKNELVTKEVNFNGDSLMATQDMNTGKIYVGISWVCNGIGFNKHQKDRQVVNVQEDIVLKRGCLKFEAGVFDDNNDTIAIELDYLPLWLAKISITPKMKNDTPELAYKLINYQTQAKDVLAKAFIHTDNVRLDKFHIPTSLSEALQLSADLAKENEEMKPKAEQFDLYLQNNGTLSLNQVAKELKARRNKMMEYLRYRNVFNEDNSPSDYYATKGYFEVKSYTILKKSGKRYQVAVTRVSPSGQNFLYRYLKKNIDEYCKYDKNFKKRLQEVVANV